MTHGTKGGNFDNVIRRVRTAPGYSWLQWVEQPPGPSTGCQIHTGCVEQRSETSLPEGIGQTQSSSKAQSLPAAMPAPAEAENMEPVDPARPYRLLGNVWMIFDQIPSY